jgi:uncharacterized protein YabN with tetrapyrrole methylase and pyrophosphatase domain
VWYKVREEMNEFEEELEKNNSPEKLEDELGDILFSLVNLARFRGMDADKALEKTNQKFILRFRWMEKKAAENNKQLSDMNIEELEELWQEAKHNT